MSGGTGDQGAMSDINVTPLVDVMLVLLIIFMVTAPLLTQGVQIDLPNEVAQPLPQETKDQVVLSIDREMNYFINENKFTATEMPEKLSAMAKQNPDQVVYLQADHEVPYGAVAFLLAAAKRAGLPRIGMVFEPGED